jgi:uncharacterized lipoprotein YmbA
MICARYKVVAALALVLAGCGSAPPLHYYTLVAPVAEAPPGGPPASFEFELLPVGVPAEADRPQLLVRQGAQGILVLDGERWAAPLADEVRAALSADLSREMNARDASGLPAGGMPRLRVKLDLRRFDSLPGSYALLDASWAVHALQGGASVSCRSVIRQSVAAGYDALVQGHQKALRRLAAEIAATMRSVAAGEAHACLPQ